MFNSFIADRITRYFKNKFVFHSPTLFSLFTQPKFVKFFITFKFVESRELCMEMMPFTEFL